jgi:hypothetical protein
MNKFKHYAILLFVLLCFSENNFGQSIDYDLDYTEKYINERLASSCKLFANKKSISVEYYSKGKLVRVDEFYAEAIDREEGIYYKEKEKAIILTCYENADQCVTREILVLDEKKLYSRVNLMTNCTENECIYLERALLHLMMLYIADEDYLRIKPFEEE